MISKKQLGNKAYERSKIDLDIKVSQRTPAQFPLRSIYHNLLSFL